MSLKPCDLILVRAQPHDFLNDTIAVVTQSPYCHVAGVYAIPNLLIEAQGFQATGYEPLESYFGNYDVFRYPGLTTEQEDGILKFVKGEIGSRYSYYLILWEFFHYMFHLDLPWEDRRRFICSTLWVTAFRSVGIDICPGIKYPTPAQVASSLQLLKLSTAI